MRIHPAKLPIDQLLAHCQEQRTRSSGPGGQHRNKVETAIVLTHKPTSISGAASERRSLNENRQVAIQRLRVNLAIAFRSPGPFDSKFSPDERWKKYIAAEKIKISLENDDFPALLADAIDWITQERGDVAPVAKQLGLSTTQLVKFLRLEPAAWQVVAKLRQASGLRSLK